MNQTPKRKTPLGRLTQTQLEGLYHQTCARVWTICFRILNHEDDARDAFQETYTRLLCESVVPPTEEQSHAHAARLAAREADNLRKRRQRQQHREVKMQIPEEHHTPEVPITETLSQQEIERLVRAETSTLSDDLRVPLQLHFFDGLSQREVAEALGVSLGTVNTRIHRAFQILDPRFRRLGLQEPNKLFPALLPFAALLVPPADLSAQAVCSAAVAGSLSSGGASAVGATLGAKSTIALGLAVVAVILTLTINTMLATPKQTAQLLAPVPQAQVITPVVQVKNESKADAVIEQTQPPISKPTLASLGEEVSVPQVQEPISLHATFVDYNTQEPVGNLDIRIFEKPSQNRNIPNENEPLQILKTNESGELLVRGLKTRIYLLRAWSETHQTFDDEGNYYEEFVVVEGADNKQEQFTVFAGNILEGTVTDEFTGLPLEGVKIMTRKVEIVPRDILGLYHETYTDQNGFYRLENVYGLISIGFMTSPSKDKTKVPIANQNGSIKARDPRIRVYKKGYTEMGSLEEIHRFPRLNLARDQIVYPLSFQMRPTVEYQFTVQNESGESIPTAVARIYQSPGGFDSTNFEMTPSINGILSLELPSNSKVNLRISAEGYEDLDTPFVETSDVSPAPVAYTLKKTELLQTTIRVTDSNNKPIEANITILHGTYSPTYSSFRIIGNGGTDKVTGLYLHTFEKSSVFETETVYVEVSKEGFKTVEKVPISYEQAQQNAVIEIQLEPLKTPETYWSSGTIFGRDGLPLAGAVISDPVGESPARTISDQDGRYLLEGISWDVRGLFVTHSELGSAVMRDVEPNGSNNNLDWRTANAIVEVSVIDRETEQPIGDAKCEAIEFFSQNVLADEERSNVFYVEQSKSEVVMIAISAEGYHVQRPSIVVPKDTNYVPHVVRLSRQSSSENQ